MTAPFATAAVGGIAAAVLGACVLWTAYAAALWVCPRAGVATRWAGAAVLGYWLLAAVFWVLAPYGGFRLWVVVPLWLAAAAAARWLPGAGRAAGAALGRDLRAVARAARSLAGRPAGWAAAAVAAMAGVRLLRGSIAPPLGWDSLTYHLYRAGRWVQEGGLAPQPAPDAWSYYEYFPVVGDLYWAWAMLPLRGDALLALAGTAVWGTALLGVYAAARELGARREHAVYAAAAVGAMPSTLAYLASAYVDDTTLALFALGSVFVVRVVDRGALREAPIAAGALALMVGVKLTTAALFAVAFLLVVPAVLRARTSWRLRRLVLLTCLAAAAVGVPSYLRAWVEQGSPFHPFRIVLGAVVLSEGSPAAVAGGASMADERYRITSGELIAHTLFRPDSAGAFVNPGLGAPLLAVLGVWGAAVLLLRRRRRAGTAFLAISGALMLAGFLSGNMEVFRTTIKVTTAGRYLLPAFAAAAILGAGVRSRLAVALWIPAVLGGLALALPRGWAEVETGPVLALGGLLLVLGSLLVLLLRSSGSRGWLAATAVLLSAGLAVGGLESLRAPVRYAIYEKAADGRDPLFLMHPLHPIYAGAWPIWRHLDDPEGHRIAATAGWDGLGHNWYRYPLLGSRLQNRVLYVPVTADGSVVDHRLMEEVARRASFEAWLARLVEEEVDYVVSLAPRATIEDVWMRSAPDLFRPETVTPRNFHAAFRLDRAAALEALRDPPGPLAPPQLQ